MAPVKGKSRTCTNCAGDIPIKEDIRKHPILGTPICRPCHVSYRKVSDLTKYREGVDQQGQENYCRWCLDGGDLILCGDENCRTGWCYNCITRNFGKARMEAIRNSDDWYCFICNYTQLDGLREPLDIEVCRSLINEKKHLNQSDMPSADITNSDVPNTDQPKLDESRLDVPSVDEPKLDIPTVEVPNLDVPIEKVPDIEGPNRETPDLNKSNEKITDVEAPNLNIPNGQLPNGEVPNVEVPGIEVPSVNVPNMKVPSLEVPNVEEPSVKVLSVEVSNTEVPGVKVSNLDVSKNQRSTSTTTEKKKLNFKIFSSTTLLSRPTQIIMDKNIPKPSTIKPSTPKQPLPVPPQTREPPTITKEAASKMIFNKEAPPSKPTEISSSLTKPDNPPKPPAHTTSDIKEDASPGITLEQELLLSDDSSDESTFVDATEVQPSKSQGWARWALRDALILKKRFKLLLDSLNQSYNEFDLDRFEKDPVAFLSHLDNLRVFLDTASHVSGRCRDTIQSATHMMSSTDGI